MEKQWKKIKQINAETFLKIPPIIYVPEKAQCGKKLQNFFKFKNTELPLQREFATFYLRIIRFEKPDHAYRYQVGSGFLTLIKLLMMCHLCFFYNKKTKREMVLSNEKLRSKVMKNKLQKKNYFMLAAIIRRKKRPIVCIYVFFRYYTY